MPDVAIRLTLEDTAPDLAARIARLIAVTARTSFPKIAAGLTTIEVMEPDCIEQHVFCDKRVEVVGSPRCLRMRNHIGECMPDSDE